MARVTPEQLEELLKRAEEIANRRVQVCRPPQLEWIATHYDEATDEQRARLDRSLDD